ncbi:MAG: hypothetical protein Fur006_38110 [Coleofasciculaceae cyanobacterium]
MTTQSNLEAQDILKTTEDNQLYDYPRRDLHDIQTYLERVLELIELEAFDTAVCSAVFITEAVMRSLAERHSLDFESKTPISDRHFTWRYCLLELSQPCDRSR